MGINANLFPRPLLIFGWTNRPTSSRTVGGVSPAGTKFAGTKFAGTKFAGTELGRDGVGSGRSWLGTELVDGVGWDGVGGTEPDKVTLETTRIDLSVLHHFCPSYQKVEMEESGADEFGVGWRPPNLSSQPQHWHWHPLSEHRSLIADFPQQRPRQCPPPQLFHGDLPVATPPTSELTPPPVQYPHRHPTTHHYPQLSTTVHLDCKSPLMIPAQDFDQHHPTAGGWPPHASYYPPPQHFSSQQHHNWPVQQHEMPSSSSPFQTKPINRAAPLSSTMPPSSALSCKTMKGSQIKSIQHQSFTPQQKVQNWNLFGPGQIPHDSGVHSMSHSTANSVMSNMHHPLSCISTISSLPDDISSLQDHPYFQHIPSGLRHEDPEKIREVLPELVPLINDDCEEVVLRALNIINGIAKKDKSRAPVEAPLIGEQKVVEGLLRTMKTHRKNKRLISYSLRTLHFISDNEHSGRDLFVRTIDAHGMSCLEELVHSIGIPEHSCFKYAFLVLHNLISDQRLERRVIAYLCEMRTLTQVLSWLDDKNEKFLNIVTDIMQKLITKNPDQMAFFIGLNGHQKLINVIGHCRQEALLWRVTKLIDKIVQMDAERIVAAGLLEAMQRHLDHPSQRLLRQVLSCIRSKLLQLLGTSDLRLKESCADILANLCANNAQNKAFLVENGAVPALFQLLYELDSVRNGGGGATGDDSFQRQLEGIQETALTLLKSLCTGPNDDLRVMAAKQQVLHNDGHKRLLLEKLREWHFGLLRRALLLLIQLANSDSTLLCQLRFLITFAPRPRFPQSPDSHPVEHYSTELCRHCLDSLRAMSRDELLLEEIYSELRSRRVTEGGQGPRLLIPQLLLCFSDQLAAHAIFLLAELARIPETIQMICRHPNTVVTLRRWADKELEQRHNSKQQQQTQAAQKASQLLQLIGLGRAHDTMTGGRGRAQHSQFSALAPMREELSSVVVQNDFPAMDCSSTAAPTFLNEGPIPTSSLQITSLHSECLQKQQHHQTDHSTTILRNKEQLAQFGTLEEMQQDLTLSSGDDFIDDFGLFVNALCPNSSPNWVQNCHKQ
uniref:Uncharacterized protein n=1 Tax=Globodera rostochiensis TaxID=31243 RepID=A0A914GWC2_GLORO